MEQTTAEVTREIEEERRDLDQNIAALTDRAKSAIDWRQQVAKRPAVALGAALVGGMLLAGMTRRRRPRPEASGPSNERGSAREHRRVAGHGPVTGALMAAATTAIAKMLGEMVPGFRGEHQGRSNRTNGAEKPGD